MSSALYGLAQGMQRATATRGLVEGPDRFEEGSRYNSLSPSGHPSGWLAAGEEPKATTLKGPVHLRESLSSKTLLTAPLRSPCRMVAAMLYTHTQPPTIYVFGATEKCAREGRVPTIHTSDCESVLFTHELVGALLPFSGKVAIGEMVAVKALVGSAVGAVEDGEGEAR